MRARIRKLEEKDFKAMEQIENYNAKIILEELQSNNDDQYIGYGVFIGFDTLIGFCGLSHGDEFDTYENWNENSRAISELYILDIYNDDLEIYCDLFDFILQDECNKEFDIYYDNNINLPFEYYDQLGFIQQSEGILVRPSLNNNIDIENDITNSKED